MRKLEKILLSLILMIALLGCGNSHSQTSESDSEMDESIKKTEILIIGGGFAGMTAAIIASEKGAEVILIDKMSMLGGAGTLSSGAMNAYGSKYEEEYGIEGDSAELLKEDILKAGNGYNVEWMVDTFVDQMGEAFDWVMELGVKFNDPEPSEEHSVNRVFLCEGRGSGITSALTQELEKHNVEVMTETEATALLTDENNKVIGAKVLHDGNTMEIHAESVILATGGYGANPDLLTEDLANAPYYGFIGSTGDGHLMAEAIGANIEHMEFGKVYPAGWQYEEGKARIQTGYDNFVFATTGAICINSEGIRVFREGGYNADFKKAIINDPKGLVYLLLDNNAYQAWEEKVLANAMGMMTTEEDLKALIEAQGNASQVIYRADTLDELAALAGMDEKTLKETVERYNGFVEQGEDLDFHRTSLNGTITEGPYTLVAQYLRFATTIGGVEINESYQVLNTEHEAIEGLYAAGEVIYGLHGNDTIQGSPIGWALISGKNAAISILDK